LLGTQVYRGLDSDLGEQVTLSRIAYGAHTFAAESKYLAGLCPRRDFKRYIAVKRWELHLPTQCCSRDTDWDFTRQVCAISGKQLVWIHTNLDIQVARRATISPGLAFTRQAYPVAVVDTARHFD